MQDALLRLCLKLKLDPCKLMRGMELQSGENEGGNLYETYSDHWSGYLKLILAFPVAAGIPGVHIFHSVEAFQREL